MKSTYTRDVDPKMMDFCKDDKVFGKFVEFVKQHDDLALCFRGNDSEMGTVTIYRHNHMMWQLKIDMYGCPVVGLSMDHCRFMADWDTYAIKGLMEIGFKPTNDEYRDYDYDALRKLEGVRPFASCDSEGQYHAIDLEYRISGVTAEQIYEVVKESYIILRRMQNEYFNPLKENLVKVCYSDHAKVQPINFIKAYYEGIDDVARVTYMNGDQTLRIYSEPQPCVEKHVQQEIFSLNHKLVDGLFIYDLEFAQPSKPGVKLGESNKPDMFGIRFDSEGNMKAISLIEVKSTEEAFSGKSGVKKHMQGMLEYIKDHNGELILDRKKEACRILNQYRELGMYGLDNNIDEFMENDFLNLEVEIIFVFSHGYTVNSYIEKEKSKVASLLKKSIDSQSFFRVGRREDYSNKIDFSVETKYLAAYRYPIKK